MGQSVGLRFELSVGPALFSTAKRHAIRHAVGDCLPEICQIESTHTAVGLPYGARGGIESSQVYLNSAAWTADPRPWAPTEMHSSASDQASSGAYPRHIVLPLPRKVVRSYTIFDIGAPLRVRPTVRCGSYAIAAPLARVIGRRESPSTRGRDE